MESENDGRLVDFWQKSNNNFMVKQNAGKSMDSEEIGLKNTKLLHLGTFMLSIFLITFLKKIVFAIDGFTDKNILHRHWLSLHRKSFLFNRNVKSITQG